MNLRRGQKLNVKIMVIFLVFLLTLSNLLGGNNTFRVAYADDAIPPTLPHTIVNPDFETGDLTGWTVTGDTYGDTPSSASYFWGDHSFNQHGTYHMWGWNASDGADARTGTMQSTNFSLGGNGEVNFLVGGGNDINQLYVALVRASDNQILFKATGKALPDQYERYVRVRWDAKQFIGESMYIKVVDNSSQHINVDDFNVYNVTNSIDNPSFETGDLTGWKATGDAFFVSRAETYSDTNKLFHPIGKYHLWGLEGASESEADARMGTLQSTTFKLAGTGEVNFLIGGKDDVNNLYVALVRASDGTELFKAAGPQLPENFETYKRVIWDASSHIGEDLYIKVVDKGIGHINADDFNVYNTNHNILNPDFETGDLTGWEHVSGDDFSVRVKWEVNYWHSDPINKHGHYFLWGDDMMQGKFKSSKFVLGGTGEINFLIGGGKLDSQYVTLMRASDNTELMRAKNESFSDSEALARVTWDASQYLGEAVYILVADEVAAGGWQHINVDDFNVYNLPNQIINPGFETGDLTGWNVIEGEAPGRVTSDVNYWHSNPINKNGEYHFWGEDGKSGVLKSTNFKLGGTGEINFLIGGGVYPDTEYIALVRASDDKELMKSTHTAFAESEGYDRVVWDASAYLGEEVYIKVADLVSGGGWQHVNVDDFQVFNSDPTEISNPGFETGNLSGWTVEGEAFNNSVSSALTYSAENKLFDQIGTYHVWGAAGASAGEADPKTGTMHSTTFKLAGTGEVSFSIGGNNDIDHIYVALVRAEDNETLFKATGAELPGFLETYKRVVWDATAYLGQKLYIKVIDNGDGHINVDDFHVHNVEQPSYTLLNEDFETGSFSGWTVTGDAFEVSNQAVALNGTVYGQQRNYHVIGSDDHSGSMKSGTFRLAGTGHVNFKISGTADADNLYIALIRASDDKILFKASGNGSEAYQSLNWDASRYINESLYFKVVDNSSTGHLNVDDFNYYVSNMILNADFETGDLRFWQVIGEGDAFEGVISKQALYHGTKLFKQHGTYHLWGYQGGGDDRKGTLESTHFILSGDKNILTSGRVTFSVGGGNDIDNLYVALVRDKTGEILFKTTSINDESYKTVNWDATAYVGEELYFRIVDNKAGSWGHINTDNFKTVNPISVIDNLDFETGDLTGWIVEGEAFVHAVSQKTDFDHHGTYHVYGFASTNHSLTGVLKSKNFELTGTGIISFLIGGGKDTENLYTALVRASDGMELFKTTGSDSDTYHDITWDASQYLGEEVYIKVVDNKTVGPFGYISVDDFQTSIPREYYSEQYRPQFHFTPEQKWMNDPNGMVYYNGEYHLFYQYHPFATIWGPMHWGHAVSNDLVHWEHLPIALYPDDHGLIFSGSAVVDSNNTTGFFNEEGSGLVAIYTNEKAGLQVQSLAYSKDNGRTWIKYEGNPVLKPGSTADFRDPKVFWHEPTSKWVMSIAVQNRVEFYISQNLKEWTYVSSFGSDGIGTHRGVFECPDLIQVPIDGDPKNKKWVLIISVGNGNGVNPNDPEPPAKGSGMHYYIGEFDGTTFIPDSASAASAPNWIDYGADFYAGVTWNNITDQAGRPLWLGWMSNWNYANDTPTDVWRSAMSIPRTLELKTFPEGIRLVQKPVEQLQQLRKSSFHLQDVTVMPNQNELSTVYGRKMEIVAEFELQTASAFGIKVRKSDTEETVIGYDAQAHQVYVNRTKSGVSSFNAGFAATHSAPLEPVNNRIKLHIFVDMSSVEVFANDGERVITDQIFPNPSSQGVELYANNGSVKLISLDIIGLESVWRNEAVKKIVVDSRDYSLVVNQTHQTIVRSLYDGSTEKKDVTAFATFSSSNTSVATVNTQGLVRGLQPGTTVISAVYGGYKAYATVIVSHAPIVETPVESPSVTPVETPKPIEKAKETLVIPPIKAQADGTIVIELKPTIDKADRFTKTEVSDETMKKAFEQVKENTKGKKSVVLEIQSTEEAKGNTIQLPASFLSSMNQNETIEIRTSFGTFVIPDHMFNAVDLNRAKKIELSIGVADQSNFNSTTVTAIGNRPVVEINSTIDGKIFKWSNPNAPVTIAVDYKPAAKEINDLDHIIVIYIDDNGNSVPVPNGKYDAAAGKVTFTTTHFSKYAIAFVKKTFNDLAKYSWAKKQIEVLASRGIINGTSETMFNPEKNITRADFMLLLIKTLELKAQVDSNFDDVEQVKYYYEAVGIAKKLGIIQGVGDNKFKPDDEISRQDMMVMVSRTLKIVNQTATTVPVEDLSKFSDASDVSSYAMEGVSILIKQGIIKGDNNMIHPLQTATRAETAIIMHRIFNTFKSQE